MTIPSLVSPIEKLKALTPGTNINVVLSGGGVKCAGHIALLEEIEHLGLVINAISGSSGGALVAALYASGVPLQDILTIFKETTLFKITYFSLTKAGIFDTFLFKSVIENKLKKRFEELRFSTYITASNIQDGIPVYFNKGDLLSPILASCAIPGVFSPIEIDGVLYSDGGVLDNFPIRPFINETLPLIGSYVSTPPKRTKNELNSTLKVVTQTAFLLAHSAESFKFDHTSLTIQFPLSQYFGLDNKETVTIYESCKALFL